MRRWPGDQAAVICHAGTMRLLLACKPGIAPSEMALRAAQTPHQIPYGARRVLDI
jgi:alpha-ribazole phosphatase